MDIPSRLFPKGAVDPRLTAVNSDSQMPWETFWQDTNGKVYYCEYNTQENGLFVDSTIGSAKWCDYWYGLKASDIA
jgi:hypothetical protein